MVKTYIDEKTGHVVTVYPRSASGKLPKPKKDPKSKSHRTHKNYQVVFQRVRETGFNPHKTLSTNEEQKQALDLLTKCNMRKPYDCQNVAAMSGIEVRNFIEQLQRKLASQLSRSGFSLSTTHPSERSDCRQK